MAPLLGPTPETLELEFALDVARRAGREILLPALPLGKKGEGEGYKGPRELVTETDRQVERFVVSAIREAFPDHAIYAEEETRDAIEGKESVWILDPLDGTTNFVHGHPFFAVSIALQKAGRLELGVVFAPYLDEMFFAQRGLGAFLNSRSIRLSVSDTDALIRAVLATGFAYDRERYPNLGHWCTLHEEARGLRRCGAAAMDLAYVACGRYDGFWELGLAPYDVAAGVVLVREAGGVVTDLSGGEDWLFGGSILAANPTLHPVLLDKLCPMGRGASGRVGPDPIH